MQTFMHKIVSSQLLPSLSSHLHFASLLFHLHMVSVGINVKAQVSILQKTLTVSKIYGRKVYKFNYLCVEIPVKSCKCCTAEYDPGMQWHVFWWNWADFASFIFTLWRACHHYQDFKNYNEVEDVCCFPKVKPTPANASGTWLFSAVNQLTGRILITLLPSNISPVSVFALIFLALLRKFVPTLLFMGNWH